MYNFVKFKCLYIISAVCLVCFSSTFLFMPITNNVPIEYSRLVSIIIGTIFWFTGIVGYALLIYLYTRTIERKKRRIYIFANKITIIADVIFLIGIIYSVWILTMNLDSTYLGYLNIFILVMSVNLHLIFSRNYLRKLEKKIGGQTNESYH